MIRHSLGGVIERSGVGLHSGIVATVRVLPAASGEGRYFVRIDLLGQPMIPARVDAVCETRLSTELGATSDDSHPEARVRTVEHLLAALAGCGVDDARIEINSPEVPLLDGSAQDWVDAIANVGVVASPDRGISDSSTSSFTSSRLVLQEPVAVYHGDAFVTAVPAPATRFTYGIDFDNPAIGNQWYSWTPETERFADAIAPARTFCDARQIDQMRQAGLIKGGSLDNALVCGEQGWLNPPLRFSNEPVRHKLLDLVGDLSLLGIFPVAHVLAYKASHSLHIQLAKQLALIGGLVETGSAVTLR
ncbi:MAG TPA: UDP-3-O-acyl-N-acetylglucosamine deacetylase [Coleofasciculaceae cyanobacterium]